MARVEGFEPPTAWFVARYSIQLSYSRAYGFPRGRVQIRPVPDFPSIKGNGGEGGIRTLGTIARTVP